MSGKPDDSATNGKIRTLAEGARMRQPRLAGRGHGMPCPYKVKPKGKAARLKTAATKAKPQTEAKSRSLTRGMLAVSQDRV
jgi:hypothetical protein